MSEQFKSLRSNRPVIPGWAKLIPDKDDLVELEILVSQSDLERQQAVILLEYWATPEALTIQSVLPMNAFKVNPEGWCAFFPAQGRVLIRAIDSQPMPPILASHQVNLDPDTQPGTVVTLRIQFP